MQSELSLIYQVFFLIYLFKELLMSLKSLSKSKYLWIQMYKTEANTSKYC